MGLEEFAARLEQLYEEALLHTNSDEWILRQMFDAFALVNFWED
jgi:hypothetical protein